jgi:LysM repeat protein
VISAIGTLLFLHRGDPEGSARIANREIERRLQRGEVIQRRVPVMERRWWNYFRVTHGVLAVTDRRLLFAGVPPEELLPHEPEPPEIEEESWTFDALVPTHRQRVFFSTRAGVTIGSRQSRLTLGVSSPNAMRLDSILAYIDQRMAELQAARVAVREAAALALASSRQPVYHLVDRGETLEEIAKRYGVSPEDLRAWNALARDRIVAGHRLLVKPGA